MIDASKIKKNARSKAPSFQFYANDWMGNLALQSCSIGARGLFIQLLCLMHNSSEPGKLFLPNGFSPSATKTAQLCNVDARQYRRHLPELLQNGILKLDDNGIIYCKRMIRDNELRNKRKEAGSKGGNPNLLNQKLKQNAKQNATPSTSTSSSTSISDSTATNKLDAVDVDNIPSEIKIRFGSDKQLKSFCVHCGGNIELMETYFNYADRQANIDNPTGFAIMLAREHKEQGPPLTANEIKKLEAGKNKTANELLNKIIWPEFRKQRTDLKDQSSKEEVEAAKIVIEEIANQIIGKEKPENEKDAIEIKNAIKSGKFDLHTGQIKCA